MKTLVLDASAVINEFSEPAARLLTTLAVSKELGDRDLGEIEVREPKQEFVENVSAAVKEANDNLSEQDIGLLALAIEFSATVVTDDYGIQNIATKLGVEHVVVAQDGITEVLHWGYYCPGCRRKYNKAGTCETCGMELKRRALAPHK